MALKTVNITGKLYNPDGTPAAKATGTAVLTRLEVDDGTVVPSVVSFTTDAAGLLDINLWPNERGQAGSRYRLRAKTAKNGIVDTMITVPDSDVPVSLDDVIEAVPYPPVEYSKKILEQAQTAVDTATDKANIASTAATTAGQKADAAALSESNANDSKLAAKQSEDNAKESEDNAALSAQAAADSAASIETSLTPAPHKIPIADENGHISPEWFWFIKDGIGEPGTQGFGVGVAPAIPDGYSMLVGTMDPASDNYGNYIYKDGSIMVWIPAFYYRIGHPDNPTYWQYMLNSIDIKPYTHFKDVEEANLLGYALHRSFIDGGQIIPGFMHDKYRCSNNNGIASSIKNRPPITFSNEHNPVTGINGITGITLSNMFAIAKSRGEQFFPNSRFMRSALAMLAMAHGQASTNDTFCAWYHATHNFPKGNNNNALRDVDDTSVTFTSDGYSNCALTGSGVPFAKTTHNGQNCGIADLNGNVYTAESGITCLSSSVTVTAIAMTNPVTVTSPGHGLETGAMLTIVSPTSVPQLNDRIYSITVVDSNTFTLDGVDGTGFAEYTSGGSFATGTMYATKESFRMADYTGGVSSATDHWGAVGVAATMEPIEDLWLTDYPDNNYTLRFGNADNRVLSPDTSGQGYVRTGLGFPAVGGASSSGTSLFGSDYFRQRLVNHLCLVSGVSWSSGTFAGPWALSANNSRSDTGANVGVCLASAPLRPER